MIKFENKENGRFYYIEYNNDTIIKITRGGRKRKLTSHQVFEDSYIAIKKLEEIKKRRIRNGYQLI